MVKEGKGKRRLNEKGEDVLNVQISTFLSLSKCILICDKFWPLNKMVLKESQAGGVEGMELSPETSAYQNSTHLHHFAIKISPKEIKIKKCQP